MESTQDVAVTSKKMHFIGWIVCAPAVLMLFVSAYFKLAQPPMVVEGFAKMGFPEGIALPLGILELGITLLYLIPRSSVLGAILLTGYLGGAICTHVRVSEPFHMPFLFGVLLWASLYFRDARVRALLPLVK